VWDLIVVGAGPSGLWLAKRASEEGLRVLVLEEDWEIGLPVRCTGLLGSEVHSFLDEVPGELRRFGNMLVCREGDCVELEIDSVLVERSLFDKGLASMAASEGASILLRTRALGLRGNSVITNRGSFSAPFVALAEGALGGLSRRYIGHGGDFVMGMEGILAERPESEDVKVDVTDRRAFFRWSVPLDRAKKEGFVSRPGTFSGLSSELLARKDLLAVRSGPIPVGPPRGRPIRRSVAAVGDAAYTVKASSFGGILLGMRSSECLLSHLLGEEDFSACMARLYSELRKVRVVAGAVHRLLDAGIWPRWLPRVRLMAEDPVGAAWEVFKRRPLRAAATALVGALLYLLRK